MSYQRFSVLLWSSTIFALTACGGGGGGGIASTPPAPITVTPPPPPPPPPPTPAGYEAVKVFPAITSSTSFASVGAERSGNASAPITTSGYDVRYDAGSGLYIFDLPTSAPGGFYQKTSNTPDASYWSGSLIASQSGIVWPNISVLKPGATNPTIQLTYTSLASYFQEGAMLVEPRGFVAFGSATPAGSVPTTGSATYSAIAQGASVDGQNFITGNANLQFNFGSGTLAGNFDPQLIYYYGNGTPIPLGRYDFVNTVYGVGSTTFSGQLSNSSVPGVGTFNGLFTGPNAQELMSNWTAPYRDPTTGQPSQMLGVWVGRRP